MSGPALAIGILAVAAAALLIAALGDRISGHWPFGGAPAAGGPPRQPGSGPAAVSRRLRLTQLGIAAGGLATGLLLRPTAPLPGILLALAAPAIALLLPRIRRQRAAEARRARLMSQIPLLIAQLRAQVAMGNGLVRSLRTIANSPLSSPELAHQLRSVLAAHGLGRPMDVALLEFGKDLGSMEIEILARAVAQARRLGSGLDETLARSEFELSAVRRRRVAAAAARAQVRAQLLIVSCYLPAFLALVLAPLFISVLGGLGSR